MQSTDTTPLLNKNTAVELKGIIPELQSLFAAKGLKWGSKAFFREFKYTSATAFAQKEALNQRVQDECYGFQPAQGNMPAYRYRKRCPLTDGPEPEYDRLLLDMHVNGHIEVWIQSAAGPYELFNTYQICDISGKMGPKLQQGDMQVPEGVYTATTQPYSHYYLALHVSYPNAFDRGVSKSIFRDPTLTNLTWSADLGGDIMIHGICASIGCSAMSGQIVELYAIAQSAGGVVPYHVFPFPLVPGAISDAANLSVGGWAPFWRMLQPVYDSFERDKRPANWVGRPATQAEILAGVDFKGFVYAPPLQQAPVPRVPN